jgi:hypothetical protein
MLVFQDLFSRYPISSRPSPTCCKEQEQDDIDDDENDGNIDISSLFFELANASRIGYRLKDDTVIEIHQDSRNGQHTGGIVWETSYLLLEYLCKRNQPLGRILEVGAGCGLLGIGLQAVSARQSSKALLSPLVTSVVMTDVAPVVDLLRENLKCNQPLWNDSTKANCPVVVELDWTDYSSSHLLEAHSFDTIVGTDVLFAPHLVEPLLQTLVYYAHDQTQIFLCVQVRCAESHELFFTRAVQAPFLLHVEEITCHLEEERYSHLAWGSSEGCHIFYITQKAKHK